MWEEANRTRDLFLIELVLAMTEGSEEFVSRVWLALIANKDLRSPKRWPMTHDLSLAMTTLASTRFPRLRQLA